MLSVNHIRLTDQPELNPLAKHEFEVLCLPCSYVGEFYEAPFHTQTLLSLALVN